MLVPIELDVLMVRDAPLTWAATGMATPPRRRDAEPVRRRSLLPPPFTDLPAPRPRGAYLQWYLPNGLTGGTATTPTASASFPPIPDRWLVLRISPGRRSAARAVRGWVLEAGGEPPQVTDLDGWTEPGTAPDVENPLTALGHGDLSWAGYFDNVVNRLGFYDGSLDSDKITGPIAYLVCGWYADPTADPLGDQAITSLAAFNAAMQQLAGRWRPASWRRSLPPAYWARVASVWQRASRASRRRRDPDHRRDGEYVTNGSWWPTATCCTARWSASTGRVHDTAEAGGPPDPAPSGRGRQHDGRGDRRDRRAANQAPDQAAIVEALQLGVVKELDQPDGRAQLDVRCTRSSFASQPGGARPPSRCHRAERAAAGPAAAHRRQGRASSPPWRGRWPRGGALRRASQDRSGLERASPRCRARRGARRGPRRGDDHRRPLSAVMLSWARVPLVPPTDPGGGRRAAVAAAALRTQGPHRAGAGR